jgi:predicted phosphate transport protein (TIGR00153 family)
LVEETFVARISDGWNGYLAAFERQAEQIVKAADLLRALATQYEHVSETVWQIREIEHEGDSLAREILTRLERTVIVWRGHEMREITHALDDVLDAIEAAAEAFDLYGIERPTAEATEMIELAAQCSARVHDAVLAVHANAQRRARLEALRPIVEEITRLEDLSDQIHRQAVGTLFRQDDVGYMLKWKQVYDYLEEISDRCDDVGDALQAFALRRL